MGTDGKLLLGLTREAVEHLIELDGNECVAGSVVEMGGEREGCEQCAEIRREATEAIAAANESDRTR